MPEKLSTAAGCSHNSDRPHQPETTPLECGSGESQAGRRFAPRPRWELAHEGLLGHGACRCSIEDRHDDSRIRLPPIVEMHSTWRNLPNLKAPALHALRINQRARAIGASIGWSNDFTAAPNQMFVGLIADTFDEDLEQHHVFVRGPKPVDQVIVHEVEIFLDDLEQGRRRIVADEDGDPRVI
jgi:hypothetical protein